MKNLLAISLVPIAKKQLRKISKEVLPNFGRVRINSEEVILPTGLFKRNKKIPLIDFLAEVLPKEINRWAESKDIESPLPYFGNSVEFLLHLDAISERNIISYLWKCYIAVTTQEIFEETYVSEARSYYTRSTKVITSVIANKVVRDLRRMCNNVERIVKVDGVQYLPLSVVYRSPDIRGSPELSTIYLNGGEQRLIS